MAYQSPNPLEELFKNVKWASVTIGGIFITFLALSSFFIVNPGHRGILVTLGSVSSDFKNEGVGLKTPFISKLIEVPVKQITAPSVAECYSSDLQQVNISLAILYRIPEQSIVKLYREYAGNVFEALIDPRVQEAIKEAVALETAESIVKKREQLKLKALDLARKKIGGLLVIEDLVIKNIGLSKELELAIEQKMVQEQEAAKAKFIQQKAEIEAKTAIIKASGDAEAIRIRGKSIKENPSVIDLQLIEKWNGVAPLVVGGGKGANILLPLHDLEKK